VDLKEWKKVLWTQYLSMVYHPLINVYWKLQITRKLENQFFYSPNDLLVQHDKTFGKKKNLGEDIIFTNSRKWQISRGGGTYNQSEIERGTYNESSWGRGRFNSSINQ